MHSFVFQRYQNGKRSTWVKAGCRGQRGAQAIQVTLVGMADGIGRVIDPRGWLRLGLDFFQHPGIDFSKTVER